MRYRSSFGAHQVFLLLGPAGIAVVSVVFWRDGQWLMLGLCALALCLVAWIVFGTRYVLRDGELIARVGPMRRRVRLAEVTAVHRRAVPSGAMFGLGSDFIGIEYGGKSLNVSPRDADGLVEAIRARMATSTADR